MAHYAKATPQKKGRFLSVMRQTANATRAAAAIGVNRKTVYNWRDEDPEFAEAWLHARESYAEDVLEAEADRRAVEGVHHRTYFDKDGNAVGEERRYSDTLLIFRLKGLKPNEYKDVGAYEHNVKGTMRYEHALDEHLAQAYQALEERRNGHSTPVTAD